MTRLTLLIATLVCGFSVTQSATAQQYDESDFNFISRVFDFGDGTKAGVKAFQKKKSLGVDGIAGPNTWGVLNTASRLGDAMVFDTVVDLIVLGEEIYSDEYGRVRVQLPWDRTATNTKLLKTGSKGEGVTSVQSALNR